jgi:hypothetical protein
MLCKGLSRLLPSVRCQSGSDRRPVAIDVSDRSYSFGVSHLAHLAPDLAMDRTTLAALPFGGSVDGVLRSRGAHGSKGVRYGTHSPNKPKIILQEH